jgi:hypothetical protein
MRMAPPKQATGLRRSGNRAIDDMRWDSWSKSRDMMAWVPIMNYR